jgi:hypothetical protein
VRKAPITSEGPSHRLETHKSPKARYKSSFTNNLVVYAEPSYAFPHRTARCSRDRYIKKYVRANFIKREHTRGKKEPNKNRPRRKREDETWRGETTWREELKNHEKSK